MVTGGVMMALPSLQVWKAKWNGVQVVAVKQLRSAASQKAQLDFMREVSPDMFWLHGKPLARCSSFHLHILP